MGKKIKIAKQEKKGTKEKVWIVIALISMAVYIGWRLFFTIPDHNVYGWLATICGICLAVSETISMLEGTSILPDWEKNQNRICRLCLSAGIPMWIF